MPLREMLLFEHAEGMLIQPRGKVRQEHDIPINQVLKEPAWLMRS